MRSHAVRASARMLWQLARNGIEDLMPLFVVPLLAFPVMAVFVHSGRLDLAPFARPGSRAHDHRPDGVFCRERNCGTWRWLSQFAVSVAPASFAIDVLVSFFSSTAQRRMPMLFHRFRRRSWAQDGRIGRPSALI